MFLVILGLTFTGILDAGSTPILFGTVLKFNDRRLLASTFPNDSAKPNSSPKLKPIEEKEKKINN
jgi:hypothetical protein